MKFKYFFASTLIIFLLSCEKKTQNQSNDNTLVTTNNKPTVEGSKSSPTKPNPPQSKCRADKYNRFPVLKHLSEKEKECSRDSECEITSLIAGNCCSHGCNERWVYTRNFLKRMRSHRDNCCKGIKIDCKRWSCPKNPHIYSAKCINKRCKLNKKPAAWTLKNNNKK